MDGWLEAIILKLLNLALVILIMFVFYFIALGVMELNKVLTNILAGAGVVGLAVGLALQGTFSNTFGGLILSFVPKIKINDYIETDCVKVFVSEISLRNIVLRRLDNNYGIILNSMLVYNSFTNYLLSDRSRITVS